MRLDGSCALQTQGSWCRRSFSNTGVAQTENRKIASLTPILFFTAANGTTLGYDSNGNLNAKSDASGSWTYAWDYENRLKQGEQVWWSNAYICLRRASIYYRARFYDPEQGRFISEDPIGRRS